MTATGMTGNSAGLAARFAQPQSPAGHAATARVFNIAGLRHCALSPVVGYAVASYAFGD